MIVHTLCSFQSLSRLPENRECLDQVAGTILSDGIRRAFQLLPEMKGAEEPCGA